MSFANVLVWTTASTLIKISVSLLVVKVLAVAFGPEGVGQAGNFRQLMTVLKGYHDAFGNAVAVSTGSLCGAGVSASDGATASTTDFALPTSISSSVSVTDLGWLGRSWDLARHQQYLGCLFAVYHRLIYRLSTTYFVSIKQQTSSS